MNFLTASIAKFTRLSLRERLLAVVAVAAVLYFIVDMLLLGPQQKKINALRQLDKSHMTELVATNKTLAELEIDTAKSAAQMAEDQITLDALKKQIADAAAFYGQTDATTSQVGALVRELLGASPGLTLVALKTLPVATFYMPENKAAGEVNGIRKVLYKQGIEVSVKGNYMALLSYLENLQKYPKRLFWSEASLSVSEVSVHPDAVLKLVIYSLSEQPSTPLR